MPFFVCRALTACEIRTQAYKAVDERSRRNLGIREERLLGRPLLSNGYRPSFRILTSSLLNSA